MHTHKKSTVVMDSHTNHSTNTYTVRMQTINSGYLYRKRIDLEDRDVLQLTFLSFKKPETKDVAQFVGKLRPWV
jgi:hypothetical protein